MNIFKKTNRETRFQIRKPKHFVLSEALRLEKQATIKDDGFEINFTPSFFTPFEARGRIKFSTYAISDDVTEIVFDINSSLDGSDSVYVLFFILVLWTIISLIISVSFFSFLTIVFGWLAIVLIYRWANALNIGKLENKVYALFSRLKAY